MSLRYAAKKIIIRIVLLLNEMIPKDNNRIYMNQSAPFKDNVSSLLEEMLKSRIADRYKIFLHGNNLKEYASKNIVCVVPWSLKSVWNFFRSKYVFFDNGIYGYVFASEQISVHLTHGMMFKKYGYLDNAFQERARMCILPEQICTYVTVSSKLFVKPFSEALRVPEENVLVTGLPRHDYLTKRYDVCISKLFRKSDYKKAIIWMPTYRKSFIVTDSINGVEYELGLPLISRDNIRALDEYLSKLGVVLVVKYHSLQVLPEYMEYKPDNISFVSSQDIANMKVPIDGFIAQFDALITDYSSVFYDYILLDRPICNIIDDFDEYESTRGFIYENAIEMFPDYVVRTYDELCNFIRDVAYGTDINCVKRNKMRKLYNEFCDDSNSKRIVKRVGIG